MSTPLVEIPANVAVDADETLVQFRQGVADYAWAKLKREYTADQIYPDPYQNGDDELARIIEDFLDQPDEVEQLKPYLGAALGLHILREEGYVSHLISSRRASVLQKATDYWVDINGLRPYLPGIHLSDGWFGPKFKVDKAKELKVVAAFDDDDFIARSYASSGIPVFRICNSNRHRLMLVAGIPLITQHPSFLEAVRAFISKQTL